MDPVRSSSRVTGMSSILAYARLIHVFRPSHPLSISPSSLVLNGLDAVGGVSDAGDIASAGACYLLSSPFTANQPDSHIPASSSVARDSSHHIGTQLSTENCTLRTLLPRPRASTPALSSCVPAFKRCRADDVPVSSMYSAYCVASIWGSV
ncbi:hypothetical protein FB45DRAFT_415937 [Roridomyces roridus]|uniref:Uncharacterized protein n=1 Tax=Roridomyces roridus TaxID=1738132 RepID=A0AAD7FV34_9AGAR|nr:hypothetical protein FB45DRAFT_415937 [Roridomyces roridus]